MTKGALVAGGILGLGTLYLLGRSGALDLSAAGIYPEPDVPTWPPGPLTPQQRAALATREAMAGNAPAVSSSSFAGSPQAIAGVAALGTATLPLFITSNIALGVTTAGIGLAVTFVTYELLKQRASMHTNDVRDAWQRQFIDIHDALGIRPLTYAQTQGSGPGNIEAAEVIFYFDHDANNTLWKSFTQTQDERAFRSAAMNVENFLRARGIPVLDVA